eukprot:8682-Amphidinium_carterae.1
MTVRMCSMNTYTILGMVRKECTTVPYKGTHKGPFGRHVGNVGGWLRRLRGGRVAEDAIVALVSM